MIHQTSTYATTGPNGGIVATCNCDWQGTEHKTREAAQDEGQRHQDEGNGVTRPDDSQHKRVTFGEAEIIIFRGDDGALVVDVASGAEQHVRVWLNDGEIFDGGPDEVPA